MKRSTRINICLLCKVFWGNMEKNQPQSLLCIIVPRAIRRLLYFLWAKAAFHSFLFCLWKDQSHWFRLLNKISTYSVWTGSIILNSFHRFHWWQKVYRTLFMFTCHSAERWRLMTALYSRHNTFNDFRRNKKNHLCFRLLVTKLFSMLSYFCWLWQSEQCLILCFWAFTTCFNSTMWCDFQMKHFKKN